MCKQVQPGTSETAVKVHVFTNQLTDSHPCRLYIVLVVASSPDFFSRVQTNNAKHEQERRGAWLTLITCMMWCLV